MKGTSCVHAIMFFNRGICCSSKISYLIFPKLSCLQENFLMVVWKFKKVVNPQQVSCIMCSMLILCILVADKDSSIHSNHWFCLATNHGLLGENGPTVVPYIVRKFEPFWISDVWI